MRRETEEKISVRRQLCQEYQNSGESMSCFSRAKGIPFWRLRAAIKKTESETAFPGSSFQEIMTIPLTGGSEFTVVLRNGRALKIPATFNEKSVAQLVTVLERC